VQQNAQHVSAPTPHGRAQCPPDPEEPPGPGQLPYRRDVKAGPPELNARGHPTQGLCECSVPLRFAEANGSGKGWVRTRTASVLQVASFRHTPRYLNRNKLPAASFQLTRHDPAAPRSCRAGDGGPVPCGNMHDCSRAPMVPLQHSCAAVTARQQGCTSPQDWAWNLTSWTSEPALNPCPVTGSCPGANKAPTECRTQNQTTQQPARVQTLKTSAAGCRER